MNTKIEALFATLRILISDQSRDLALAMAELRSVAAERDSFKEGRANLVAVLATYSAERDKAQIECCEANARADFADLSAERRGAELEKLRSELAVSKEKMDALACVLDGCRIQRDAATIERDTARQSLRAAEADVAETESVNSDLRTVNARLVADLAAAMERLNHAERIIMQ